MAVSLPPAVSPSTSAIHRVRYLRDLFYILVSREMKLRYKRSVLGIFWTLLNPLSRLLIMSFLYRVILHIDIPQYTSYLFSGLLIWTWFQTSIEQATGTIVNNRALLRRPGFPVTLLPAVAVMSHLIHFLLALPVLLVFLVQDGSHMTLALLALPLIMALQFIWTLSISYLTAALQVPFRDTQYLLSVLLQFMFYLTPVFYHISFVPEPYRSFYQLNPMVPLLEAYRAILLQGTLPDNLGTLLLSTGLASVLLLFGYWYFKRVSYRFVEEV